MSAPVRAIELERDVLLSAARTALECLRIGDQKVARPDTARVVLEKAVQRADRINAAAHKPAL